MVIPAAIEFVDIAGLVKGASQGEGLGNKFLTHIREVDAIVQVVRCFDDPDVLHVSGSVDPVRDIEVINTELMLADLETVQKRRERVAKDAKRGDKTAVAEEAVLAKIESRPRCRPTGADGVADARRESVRRRRSSCCPTSRRSLPATSRIPIWRRPTPTRTCRKVRDYVQHAPGLRGRGHQRADRERSRWTCRRTRRRRF